MPTSKLLYICQCPVCEQGLLRPRICESKSNPLNSVAAIVCDECDAAWTSPTLLERMLTRADGAPSSTGCQESLWGPRSHWASLEEVYLLGWYNHIRVAAVESEESIESDE